MATSVRTGNAGDMHAMFPLVVRQLEERAAVDPGLFALRPNAAERLRQWAGQALEDPRHAIVVADVDGELVGCLVVTVEQDLPIYVNDEYATVRVLWVDPRHRGKGLAGLMLKHAARECRHFGLRQLRASVTIEHSQRCALCPRIAICFFYSGHRPNPALTSQPPLLIPIGSGSPRRMLLGS